MSVEAVRQITTLLFDLDGTFVTEDNLEAETYQSLEIVRENGIKTIAVTGRSAGWCDLIARWWPVDSVVGENGAVKLLVRDKKNDTSNSFSIAVGETESTFSFNFKVENIKILPGTYSVVVSQKLLSRFTAKNYSLTYYIALEPDSTFG